MKALISSLAMSIALISCGGKTGSDSDEKGHKTEVSQGELNPVPEQLKANAFSLHSTLKNPKHSIQAVFYDKNLNVIKVSDQVKIGDPGYYPVGASTVKIFGVKGSKLEKARIFSCCGMVQDTKVEMVEDGVWTVTGFNINADSKIPPVFTIDGVDHYLPSYHKKGLINLRTEFKDMVNSMEQQLNLNQDQKDLLRNEVNKILKKNLLSEMQ